MKANQRDARRRHLNWTCIHVWTSVCTLVVGGSRLTEVIESDFNWYISRSSLTDISWSTAQRYILESDFNWYISRSSLTDISWSTDQRYILESDFNWSSFRIAQFELIYILVQLQQNICQHSLFSFLRSANVQTKKFIESSFSWYIFQSQVKSMEK